MLLVFSKECQGCPTAAFCGTTLSSDCNYANNHAVGAFIRSIIEKGATADWRQVLKDAIGEEFSTRANLVYNAPLMKWLEEQNKGRPIGKK
jgi:peptidyl-dipeptidase A